MSVEFPETLRGRYQALRVLGEGAFGRVVEAKDLETGARVAVKLMLPEAYASEELRRRFEREAEVAGRVESPYVARALGWGVAGSEPYIAFQFVAGRNLEALRQDFPGSRMPYLRARALIEQALEGLRAAHEAGVVHRDLKPENVMVDEQDRAVLTDFGLARELDEETLTRTGQVMGTIAYMAPEQMEGGSPAPHWDVYAVAVMFWELVVGSLPFTGGSFGEVYDAKRARLRAGPEEIPSDAASLLARCLSPDPERRPPDAGAFLEALRSTGEAAEAPPPAATTVVDGIPEQTGTAPQRRRPSLLPPLLLVGVLIAWAWTARPHSDPGPGARNTHVLPQAAILEALEGFEQALTEDSDVAILMEQREEGRLAGRTLELWHGARAAFRSLVNRRGIRQLLREAEGLEPHPSEVPTLSSIVLRQLLLERERRPGEALFEEGKDPGFRARLSRVFRVVLEPRLHGDPPSKPGRSARNFLHRVEQGGRRWARLRRTEDLVHREEKDGKTVTHLATRLRALHPAGDPWDDNFGSTVEVIADSVDGYTRHLDRDAPVRIDLEPEPVRGDLVLSLLPYLWGEEVVLVLGLVGREATVRLPARVPGPPPPLPGPARSNWQGMTVRIAADLVPSGFRRIEIQAVGYHDLSSPMPAVSLGEVYQQLEGPMPASLGGPSP